MEPRTAQRTPGRRIRVRIVGALALLVPTTFFAGAAASASDACTIKGTSASETIRGTPNRDVICAGSGNDIIYGLGGDDLIYGGRGDDTIYGGDGDDDLRGLAGDDVIYGEAGQDQIGGHRGDDQLYGGDGEDTLSGSEGNDLLVGEYGVDYLWGGQGEDVLYGGLLDPQDPAIDDAAGNVLGGGAGWDTIHGANGNDVIYFGPDGGFANGGPGDDRIVGPYTTTDEDSNVIMFGGPGNDVLIASNAGTGQGRGLPDNIVSANGDSIHNLFSGGGGIDRVHASKQNDFVDDVVGFVSGGDGNDTIFNVAGRVRGGDGDDTITGRTEPGVGLAADYLDDFGGDQGDDILVAPRPNSILRGGPGSDVLDALGWTTVEVWAGSDEDVDEIRGVVNENRCLAGPEDNIEGLCTP